MQATSHSELELKEAGVIDATHPIQPIGPTVGLYVWQYPLRLFHWGLVLSIAVLSFTGYYIHDPFIVGQVKYPFLMGWFRFVHEVVRDGLHRALPAALAICFSPGNRWVGWRQYVPLHAAQWKEMMEVMKFYAFIHPKPVSKIGHNAMAAFSYLGIYTLVLVEIVTGLVMFNWLRHSADSGAARGLDSAPGEHPEHPADPLLADVRVHRLRHLPRPSVHADFARRKARTDGQHLHRLQNDSGGRTGRGRGRKRSRRSHDRTSSGTGQPGAYRRWRGGPRHPACWSATRACLREPC